MESWGQGMEDKGGGGAKGGLSSALTKQHVPESQTKTGISNRRSKGGGRGRT